jgi:hypothetical protein
MANVNGWPIAPKTLSPGQTRRRKAIHSDPRRWSLLVLTGWSLLAYAVVTSVIEGSWPLRMGVFAVYVVAGNLSFGPFMVRTAVVPDV